MRKEVVRVFEGFRPEDLFAIAADIEAYPEFMPYCRAARIRERHGNHLDVENRFGLGPMRVDFRSEAVFDEPRAIDIRSTDGPFAVLHIAWRFEPFELNACRVTFSMDQDLKPGPFRAFADTFATAVETDVVDAFEKRARHLLQSKPLQSAGRSAD